MSLFQKVTRVISFNVIQTIVSKVLGIINFAILIQLLSTEEIGIIGLGGGYVALLSLLFLAPESIFIRDYKRIQPKANEYISSFLSFHALKSIILFILTLPVFAYLSTMQSDPRVGAYFLLLVIVNLLNAFTGPFRESFYGSFRQARITVIDLTVSVLSMVSLVFLFFSRDVVTYGVLQIGVALIGAGWWYWNARKHSGFAFTPPRKMLGPALDAIKGFAIWNHLSATVIRLVYQVDIVILGFFVGLADIGDYTVALVIANAFFVFPQLLQKIMSLTFSQFDHQHDLRLNLGIAVRYNTLISILKFGAFIILNHLIISFFGPEKPETVALYSLYLVGGATLFNIARPWISVCVVRVEPRRFFMELFLIPCLAAIPIYWFAAAEYGVVGVAQANVLAYGLLSIWAIIYSTLRLGFTPQIRFAPFERKGIQQIRAILFGKQGLDPHEEI